jgi:hypothetical protein
VSSRNLENEEAKARYRAVEIQPQWVVTPGKQTNNKQSFSVVIDRKYDCVFVCFPGVTTHCGCIFTAQ